MNSAALVVLLSTAGLQGWEPLTFPKVKNHTSYESSSGTIHAEADASASGLVFFPVPELPILRWRWKITGTLPKGDETKKSGDDYAARVYITFKYDPSRVGLATRLKYGAIKALRGEYPPHNAITYIWANKLPKGEAVPSPYTSRVMMVAVRSGNAEAGEWRSEERNVREDYRRLFKEEPPPYAGVAIMTDADDTGGTAEAWYADIAMLR